MHIGGYFETVESWRAAIAAMRTHMDNGHALFSVSWRKVKAR